MPLGCTFDCSLHVGSNGPNRHPLIVGRQDATVARVFITGEPGAVESGLIEQLDCCQIKFRS